LSGGDMKIPKRFKIGGRTITIEYDSTVDKDGKAGWAKFREGKLTLDSSKVQDQGYTESTFFHELTHFILWAMGDNKSNDDERFVECFGNFMHQVMTTMEHK